MIFNPLNYNPHSFNPGDIVRKVRGGGCSGVKEGDVTMIIPHNGTLYAQKTNQPGNPGCGHLDEFELMSSSGIASLGNLYSSMVGVVNPITNPLVTQSPVKVKTEGLKVGDKVKFVYNDGVEVNIGDGVPKYFYDSNPANIPPEMIIHGKSLLGTSYKEQFAEIITTHNEYYIVRFPTDNVQGYTQLGFKKESLVLVKKGKAKPIEFNLKNLEALVVSEEVREEIVAVLKQHKNSKKLFETWGLAKSIEYGRGMTFLFYGPPGTGKTWGANCIGKVVNKELLSIGAAEIQTSEPGGANRNIQSAFATAKKENKILFIDECDSLITSRADVGMILGGEINTLLTEIEKCEGIVILATNRIENLDEALERRISLIVEFPEPNFEQREQIWKRLVPKKMPLGAGVSFDKLAEHKLTGGQIKNVVLQAARLALSEDAKKVGVVHFEAAIKRINKSKSLMGSASRYHQEVVRDVVKSRDVNKG